jgi:hypothetical protein
LVLATSQVFGQAAAGVQGKIPAPKVGVAVEPVAGKQGPEVKFTNSTDTELRFIYGNEKFSVKPGKSKSVADPQQAMFDFLIAEVRGNGQAAQLRLQSKSKPNAPKRFIPFPWAVVEK